jgi:hypothetical protein
MDPQETELELTGSETPEKAPSNATPEVAPSKEVPSGTEEKVVEGTPSPTPEPVLYETPDGRKVDAETLQREWKENFLPEFTRKSQRLAELEREDITGKDKPKWKDPDYVPENYAEVIELAKAEALAELQNSARAEQERVNAIKSAVDSQIAEIKKADANLDENALFQHANKYGFKDLVLAYQNMSHIKKVVEETEQRTLKNVKTREADPISTGENATVTEDDGYDPEEARQYDGAASFLARLKKK